MHLEHMKFLFQRRIYMHPTPISVIYLISDFLFILQSEFKSTIALTVYLAKLTQLSTNCPYVLSSLLHCRQSTTKPRESTTVIYTLIISHVTSSHNKQHNLHRRWDRQSASVNYYPVQRKAQQTRDRKWIVASLPTSSAAEWSFDEDILVCKITTTLLCCAG